MWPKDNPESWRQIYEFIDEFPNDDYWSRWKPMACAVISELDARGLSSLFRIGQSMHHIILSTTERHGLNAEPRVTLEILPKEQRVRVAYSYANLWFKDALLDDRVDPSNAVPCTLHMLNKLWSETKPGTKIPDALNPS